MTPEYQLRCVDCDLQAAGASDPELLDLLAPDDCAACGGDLERAAAD